MPGPGINRSRYSAAAGEAEAARGAVMDAAERLDAATGQVAEAAEALERARSALTHED
jgi:hypothetical protein